MEIVAKEALKLNILQLADVAVVAIFYLEVAANPSLTAEVLEYEYLKNPDLFGGYFYYTNDQNDIAAGLGYVGFTVMLNGKPIKTALLERSLVRRSYLGTTAFIDLEKTALDHAKWESELKFIWCLTTKRISVAFTKLGYEVADCLRELVMTAFPSTDKPTSLIMKHGYSQDIEACTQSISAQNPDTAFMYYTPTKAAWLADNNHFIQRTFVRFYQDNMMVGFALLRLTSNSIRIEDLIVACDIAIEEITAHLIDYAKIKNLTEIRFTYNQDNHTLNQLAKKLSDCGFGVENSAAVLIYRKTETLDYTNTYLVGTWAPPYWAAPPKPGS